MKKTVKQKIDDLGIHAIGSFRLMDGTTENEKWYITWGEKSSDVFQYLQGMIEDMFVNEDDLIHPDINCGCTHTLSIGTLNEYYEVLNVFTDGLPMEDDTYFFIEVNDNGIQLYSKTKKTHPTFTITKQELN